MEFLFWASIGTVFVPPAGIVVTAYVTIELSRIPIHRRYRHAMRAVAAVLVLQALSAMLAMAGVKPKGPPTAAWVAVVLTVSCSTLVALCEAMRWLVLHLNLKEVASSWRGAWIWCVAVWVPCVSAADFVEDRVNACAADADLGGALLIVGIFALIVFVVIGAPWVNFLRVIRRTARAARESVDALPPAR